jgi:hypothetical protein
MQPPWHRDANCSGLDVEDALKFFGDSVDPMSAMTQHRWAQMFCRECPVRMECLNWCLDTESQFGVWGGMTESQRKRYLYPLLGERGRSDAVLRDAIAFCDSITREPSPARELEVASGMA